VTKTRSPRLSARAVATLPPGLHGDTANLLLCVKHSGSRSWIFRYQLSGRRHDLGLGPVDLVSLKQAREKALDLRRRILAGEDPAGQRRTDRRASGATFESCAAALIAAKAPEWTDKQRADWESTLRRHAYPHIGRLPVGSIDTADVLTCLQPIWTARTTTAARLRARIEATLDYAGAMGARTGENPARWRGHLSKLLAQPRKVAPIQHHPALDWRAAPEFDRVAGAKEPASSCSRIHNIDCCSCERGAPDDLG
jgi:Phage integrase central domain/Arm DNA-binding domain